MGIVLAGTLVATLGDKRIGQMGVGTIVGEVAFFAGGTRMADVSGAEAGYIASIMVSDLAPFFKQAPRTAYKLLRRTAMNENRRIGEVAAGLVSAYTLLGDD